jgi:hypothetical protein
VTPYYADESVTLYHGDSREVTEWLSADVLVTDPPYGRAWKQGRLSAKRRADDSHKGIANDGDTTARDDVLGLWGTRPAVVFGDLMLAPPVGTKLVAIYRKPLDAGVRGSVGGFRRDVEGIYLMGKGCVSTRASWTSAVQRDRRPRTRPHPTEPWRETSQPGIRRLALEATRAAVADARARRTTVNPEGAPS